VKKYMFLLGLGWMICTQNAKAQKPTPSVGRIDFIEKFPSQHVDARSFAVWLPRDYSPNKKYNVIYLHDGQNLFDSTITWNQQEWHIDEHLQKLIDSKKIKPCIAVGIWNNGEKRHVEYFPQKPFENLDSLFQDSLLHVNRNPNTPMFAGKVISDQYLLFLTCELVPYIQSIYPIRKQAKHCTIAGASMGGLISWYAALEYPQTFGNAACFSTHWPGIWPADDQKKKIFQAFLNYAQSHPSKKTHWYFDHGTEGLDQFYAPYQKDMDAIYSSGRHFSSIEYGGFDHSEKAWSHHFENALLQLWK
jgi:enterochelin esterase-like enzyme